MGANDTTLGISQKALELRLAFDRAFAEPAQTSSAALDNFLAIRIVADPHVVRLSDISSLLPLKKVTLLPSPLPALLGITGFRGAVIPIFDLRVLLGYPASEPPRWTAIAADMPVGLAFDAFDGHLRSPREASVQPISSELTRPHVREVLRCDDVPRPVVSVFSVLETIRQGHPHNISSKE
ncbi:MAG: chemotaxis protein CheW [Burkholderiales bacterium]|jgi:chemotaxis signal transduction protein|nr:chemotaxis protein CheW [Burkholderiales bacterium]